MSVVLSDPVAKRALAEGPVGAAWAAGLTDQVAALERDWRITVGQSLEGGTGAFVAEALTEEHQGAILKLPAPWLDASMASIRVLRAANGRGYARLIRYDENTGAMLLEKLGPHLASFNLPPPERHAALCATLLEAWEVPPPDDLFMTGAEKAESLALFIEDLWARLKPDRPRAIADHALDCAERRRKAFDPSSCILGHGDAHSNNLLQAPALGEGRWKFIDPEGLFIEPAYDLGVIMREEGEELLAGDTLALARDRSARLSRLTGAPEEPIWEWGVIERLSTGLLCVKLGLNEWVPPFLDVAERLVPRA